MTELQKTINHLEAVCFAANLVLERMKKAQKDLEKPTPHKWEHGDIFRAPPNVILMYLKFSPRPPQIVSIVGPTGGAVKREFFAETIQDAKFLFNIREKL